MSTLVLALGVLCGAAMLAAGVELVVGGGRVPRLADQALADAPLPSVSIVVAARDEVRQLEPALRSLLALAYAPYEVIAVDDRSTDGTGALLDRIAAAEPRLRVVHVRELPAGWLGKNHALHTGAARAAGDLLLFTDADVVLDETALARAVGYLRAERVGHVTVSPDVRTPTLPLTLAVHFFALAFALYMRPWRAADPRSRFHVGIGAFNLVRASAYRAVGGHERIALRPDDDMKLGKLLKRAGVGQRLLGGEGMVAVEWYATLGEFVRGLRKNSFAGLEYNVWLFLGSLLGGLLVNVWPFVALAVTHGPARIVYAAVCALAIAMYGAVLLRARAPAWLALGYPVAALLFLYTVASATLLTLARGGIEWRGTRYPLADLRGNRV